jgi:hypothetical protein
MVLLLHTTKVPMVNGKKLGVVNRPRNNLTNVMLLSILNNTERYTARYTTNIININNTENTHEL